MCVFIGLRIEEHSLQVRNTESNYLAPIANIIFSNFLREPKQTAL